MAKSKRKTEAAKSAKPKAPEKPKTLDELLAPKNDYERLVAAAQALCTALTKAAKRKGA